MSRELSLSPCQLCIYADLCQIRHLVWQGSVWLPRYLCFFLRDVSPPDSSSHIVIHAVLSLAWSGFLVSAGKSAYPFSSDLSFDPSSPIRPVFNPSAPKSSAASTSPATPGTSGRAPMLTGKSSRSSVPMEISRTSTRI